MTRTLTERLEALATLEAAATEPPWREVAGMIWRPGDAAAWLDLDETEDAALIAAARNALPELLAVVRAAGTLMDDFGYWGPENDRVAWPVDRDGQGDDEPVLALRAALDALAEKLP